MLNSNVIVRATCTGVGLYVFVFPTRKDNIDLRSAFDAPTSAIVLVEEAFGDLGGKTATGVLLHSKLCDVRVVVDFNRVRGD